MENEARLTAVEHSLKVLHQDVRSITEKMSELITAVTRAEARPQWELHKILTTVAAAVVTFGALAGGIIYIASNVSAPATLENRLRLEFMQKRLDSGWFRPLENVTTAIRRVPKGVQ